MLYLQGIRIEVLLEMIMGYISPGKPIANITFKVYGLMSYAQASFFIANLKLGLYIKIPPKLMFLIQVTALLRFSSPFH